MNNLRTNPNEQIENRLQNLRLVNGMSGQIESTNVSDNNSHRMKELALKRILEKWDNSLKLDESLKLDASLKYKFEHREAVKCVDEENKLKRAEFINDVIQFHKGNIKEFPEIPQGCHNVPDIFWFEEINKIENLGISCATIEFYPSILNLPLKKIRLYKSELTEFPAAIKKITKLNYLILGGNKISIVPDWINVFENLTKLYLQDNELSLLPNSIGNLSNLEELILNNNKLEYLPDTIGNLEKLKDLNVRENNLVKLPNTIGKLKSLENLNCYGNKLKNLPIETGDLTSLRILDIRSNCLVGLPETIGNLTELRIFFFEREVVSSSNAFAVKVDLPKSILNLAFANLRQINEYEVMIGGLQVNNPEKTIAITIPYEDYFRHLMLSRWVGYKKINDALVADKNNGNVKTLDLVGISDEKELKNQLANKKFENLENLTLESNYLKIRTEDGLEQFFIPSWLADFKNLRRLTFTSVWNTKSNE